MQARPFDRRLPLTLGALFLTIVLASGCLGNESYQATSLEEPPENPGDGCERSYEESPDGGYGLGVVEFTERGNVFRRDCMELVLERVKAEAAGGNTAVIVFVHGWRHNAQSVREDRDQNLHCFKQLLSSFGRSPDRPVRQDVDSEICFENQFDPGRDFVKSMSGTLPEGRGVLYDKNVVGIYVGWRGLPYRAGFLELASYWDRKEVAEEVGGGGVTELLLRLEDLVWRPGSGRTFGMTPEQASALDAIDGKLFLTPEQANTLDAANGNVFLTIGHSFGGAIVLSALNDIFIERIVSAQRLEASKCRFFGPGKPCSITRPFGHGVVLLNPAIEANQITQLKELASGRRFSPKQSRLLHVISTEADDATHKAFPLGQTLGVGLTWRQAELWRQRRRGDWVSLDEWDLDTTTVGNFPPFRTGFLDAASTSRDQDPRWCYRSCVPVLFDVPIDARAHDCVDPDEAETHYPVRPFEPVAFIYTDESFMSGHNDIFNPRVRAYLAAIVAESLRRRDELPAGLEACEGEGNFQTCFESFLQLEADYLRSEGWDPTALGGYADDSVCRQEREDRIGL